MKPICARLGLPIAITLALAAASGVHAATITVDSADDNAASTFCNLRDALTSIDKGNTTSTPTCAGAVSGTFGSDDTVVFASGLVNATITLMQGEIGVGFMKQATITGSGQTINADGHSRVFEVSQYGKATLSNLTLTGGSASAGGGIEVDWYGSLILNNCIVSNNSAGLGGGIHVSPFAGARLSKSTVSGNSATVSGGGLDANSGSLILSESTVSNNTTYCPSNHSCGGGIDVRNGPLTSLTVIDSTISGNTISGHGDHLAGGVYLGNAFGTFINSTITGNSAVGNDYLSGGLWELSSVTRSLTLINSTVVSNSASSYGAGTHVGGGVVCGVGPSGYAGDLTLTNTIVSGNTPASADVLLGSASTLSASYNLLGMALNVSRFNVAANHNIFSGTPGVGPLQNNGGATQTLALLPGSPALGTGSVNLAVYSGQPIHYDQRGYGFARTLNGSVDIGAFETQGGILADRIFADSLEAIP